MIQINAKDAELIIDDGNTYTSSSAGKVATAATYYDLGANYNQRSKIVLNIEIGAIDNTTTDETYQIELQQSDDSDFSPTIESKAFFILDKATHVSGNRYKIVADVAQRYVRSYYTLGGTTPSLAVTSAFLSDDNV